MRSSNDRPEAGPDADDPLFSFRKPPNGFRKVPPSLPNRSENFESFPIPSKNFTANLDFPEAYDRICPFERPDAPKISPATRRGASAAVHELFASAVLRGAGPKDCKEAMPGEGRGGSREADRNGLRSALEHNQNISRRACQEIVLPGPCPSLNFGSSAESGTTTPTPLGHSKTIIRVAGLRLPGACGARGRRPDNERCLVRNMSKTTFPWGNGRSALNGRCWPAARADSGRLRP